MTDQRIPDGHAPGEYKLVREHFVALYLHGKEDKQITVNGTDLANAVAELFSSDLWHVTRNQAMLEALREQHLSEDNP